MNSKIHHVARHGTDFLILFILLAVGLGMLMFFQYNVEAQIASAVAMCLSYAVWGIFHHFHEGNLNSGIVIEYVSISVLIAFALVIFLLRA